MKKLLQIGCLLLLYLGGCIPLIRTADYHNTHGTFHKRISLSMTVHIVESRNQFPVSHELQQAHPHASGWAYPHEIWVLGYRLPNGKIRMYHELLGHEVTHVLHWQDSEIEDPDKHRTFLILR